MENLLPRLGYRGRSPMSWRSQMADDRLAEFRAAITEDTRNGFDELITRISGEELYGFAIYSDDSLTGFDAAVNSVESHQRKISRPRDYPFDAYWYTISWGYEGGVAAKFDHSSSIAELLASESSTDSAEVQFRRGITNCMIDAMETLKDEGYFARFNNPERTVLQVDITDSEEAEAILETSLQRLNPDSVWKRYLREKQASQH